MTVSTRSLTLLMACVGLAGCISYKSTQDLGASDVRNPADLQYIELGETSTAWLISHFGHPQAVHPRERGKLWQYENIQRTRTQVRALPLLAIELENYDRTLYNFEIEQDRIVKFWSEKVRD